MAAPSLSHVRIILVEPAGALNVGSAARVMANMGLSQMVLVNPHCDPLGEEAQRMAVHAQAVLAQATVVKTLPEALTGCQRAIATTARVRAIAAPLERPDTALPWLLEIPEAPTALIFGPEDRGLSNAELNQAQRFVCIPSDAAYPSLNLAQAIAICCYELAQAACLPRLPGEQGSSSLDINTAPLEQLEGFYQHLQSLLLQVGYLYPHTASSRMEKFRRFFLRAAPTQQELAMLRGILRQVEWALTQAGHSSPAKASPSPPQDEPGC